MNLAQCLDRIDRARVSDTIESSTAKDKGLGETSSLGGRRAPVRLLVIGLSRQGKRPIQVINSRRFMCSIKLRYQHAVSEKDSRFSCNNLSFSYLITRDRKSTRLNYSHAN